jgi:hypothetical protein
LRIFGGICCLFAAFARSNTTKLASNLKNRLQLFPPLTQNSWGAQSTGTSEGLRP